MKDTIKAKVGYAVKRLIKNGKATNFVVLYDGNEKIMYAELRSMDDYKDEYINGNNECAVKYEVFTTVKGTQFIYWGCTETGEDFLTK